MWNEEKFFKDFNKENNTVKPRKQFVSDLKDLEKNKDINTNKSRYAVAAMVAVIIIGLGVTIWQVYRKTNSTYEIQISDKADKQDEKQFESVKSGVSKKDEILNLIKNHNIVITDSNGFNVSNEERLQIEKDLLNLKAVLELPNTPSKTEIYYINKTSKIKIYDNKYIEIEGKIYEIKK